MIRIVFRDVHLTLHNLNFSIILFLIESRWDLSYGASLLRQQMRSEGEPQGLGPAQGGGVRQEAGRLPPLRHQRFLRRHSAGSSR